MSIFPGLARFELRVGVTARPGQEGSGPVPPRRAAAGSGPEPL